MSTAFRYREAACGPRARRRHAAPVPGLNAEPRGHYEPRALGPLGSPFGTEPERPAPQVTPAPVSPRLAPPHFHSFSGLRGPRLRHSPPLFQPMEQPP